MTKSVCIIGAGPAGLVAAKTLRQSTPSFSVTVFEKTSRLGGLWPSSLVDRGMINPQMCTNLSRHTVSFSDLAWPGDAPTFPKAWMVGQYLGRYAERYGVKVRTGCEVVSAERSEEGGVGKRWRIEVKVLKDSGNAAQDQESGSASTIGTQETRSTEIETHQFDHIIITCGFFGSPRIPAAFQHTDSSSIPVIHSSAFRDISTLLGSVKDPKPGKILVVGGSISGAEIAAHVANQLSSEKYSPEKSQIKGVEGYTVEHVMQKPFWTLPLFVPRDPLVDGEDGEKKPNPSPTFLPIDNVTSNLSTRPPGPLINRSGIVSPAAAQQSNFFFWTLTGGAKACLSSSVPDEDDSAVPWLTISDSYTPFVRTGEIATSTGLALRLGTAANTVVLQTPVGEKVVKDVAAVILATGFNATTSISFLSPEILEKLNYDATCPSFPLELHIHSTINPSVPDLGFVGFYRGPYWGILEMQARYLASLWSGTPSAQAALLNSTNEVQTLRKAWKQTPDRLAQFPQGDYPFIIESFHALLGTVRAGEDGRGAVIPSRYTLPSISPACAAEAQLARTLFDAQCTRVETEHRFVARAIFTALQGTWTLERKLQSKLPTHPSGTFSGTASFHPRSPTAEGVDAEYLYIESGTFATTQGFSFTATRRYVYRYAAKEDKISAWFVKPDDNLSTDYLFHELDIEKGGDGKGWMARSHHLCVEDTYDPVYEFRFKGAWVERWTLGYEVRGPKKDYRIENVYTRP